MDLRRDDAGSSRIKPYLLLDVALSRCSARRRKRRKDVPQERIAFSCIMYRKNGKLLLVSGPHFRLS